MAELENGWYISSTDDPNLEYVIDNGNGKYTFKPEAGGKTYEITYVEDGKTGTTIYTPNTEECNPCYKETTFSGWAGPNRFSPFPSTGGTAKVVYNLGECWEVKVVSNTKNATAVTTSQTSSTISVARNTTTGIVQSDVIYEFKNKYVPTATKQQIVSIFQQSKCSEDKICPVVTPTSATVSKTGGTVSVQFDADECWTLTKSLDKPGSVASFESDKKIKVEANASSEPRTITATYTFSNSYSDTYCDPQNVVITQEEGCNCSNVTYEVVKSSFTHEGGNAVIGNLATCDRNKTSIEVKSGSSYITSGPTIGTPTNDVYPVSITVKSNETRDTTHHVKYVINFDGQQCKPGESETPSYYDLIIEPKGCTCTCGAISRIAQDKPEFQPLAGGSDLLLKRLQLTSQFNENDCPLDIFEPYVWPGYENKGIVPGSLYVKRNELDSSILEIRGGLTEASEKRAIAFGIKICGQDCIDVDPPFYVFQRCYCGTDDCRNEYNKEGGGVVIEDHPMYVAGCVNDGWDDEDWPQTRFPYPQYPKGKYHSDADSIFVDTLYVIPMKSVNGTLSPMYATANNPDGKVRLCHKANGAFVSDISSCTYWPEDRLGNKPVLVTYNELNQPLGIDLLLTGGRPMIVVSSLIGAKTEGSPMNVDIIYDENNHHENVQMYLWRDDATSAQTDQNTKWEVLLATDDETTKAGPNPGVACCSEFITTIHQAKKGYRYNKDTRIDDMAILEQCP